MTIQYVVFCVRYQDYSGQDVSSGCSSIDWERTLEDITAFSDGCELLCQRYDSLVELVPADDKSFCGVLEIEEPDGTNLEAIGAYLDLIFHHGLKPPRIWGCYEWWCEIVDELPDNLEDLDICGPRILSQWGGGG